MKNISQKSLALFLSAFCCCSVLTSCSETNATVTETNNTNVTESSSPNSTTPSETIDPMLLDNLPDVTFDGYTFRVLSCEFVGRELALFLMAEEQLGEAVNDALFDSTAKIEERFDVDMTYINVSDVYTLADTVKNAVSSNIDEFDIQCGMDFTTANLAKQGMLYNMYDVEQFNFEKPWWPKNIVSQLDIAGKLYLGSTYLTYNGLHWTRVLIANKDRFEEEQIAIPYEDIINGTWYMDDMIKMLEGTSKDLNGDGNMDKEDFWAFCMGIGSTYCLKDTFGISFYKETEDDLILSVDQERTVQFIDKMRELINNKDITWYGNSTELEFSQEMFLADRVLLATTMIGTAYDTFRGTDIRYCILPYPKLDEIQEEYISTCTDAFWAIPITAVNQLDVIGTVIEALSCSNYQNVLPVYFESALKTRLSDSPEDAAMFDIIKDTRTIGIEHAYELEFDTIVDTCVIQKVDFASFYKRWERAAQRKATELYETFRNLQS